MPASPVTTSHARGTALPPLIAATIAITPSISAYPP
jgi:hypothetical protein